MWENETVVLVTSLKKRILSGNERVRFEKITADDGVPIFIKNVFKDRFDAIIAKESPVTLKSTPHFDFKSEDMELLRQRFLDILREFSYFHETEIEGILKDALILRLDYLVKPIDTMRRQLFDGKDHVSVSDTESVLGPFRKNLPYADEVIKSCRGLGKSSLAKDEYGRIVDDIIRNIMKEDPVRIILRDFSVLTDFLSETKGEEITRIEGSVIQDFLADRRQSGFRKALDVEMKLGRNDFGPAELEVTLKRYLELKDELSKEPDVEKEEAEKEAPAEKNEKETQAGAEAELGNGWDLEEVLSEEPIQVEDEAEQLVETPEEPPKQMRIIRREQKKEEESVQLEESVSVAESDGVSEKIEGLHDLIDEKTEKVFVKKLFGGENDTYESLIKQLDEAENWREAKILIDNELFKRDVDPFSREAIKLVDLVYGRYYPDEGTGGAK
jgi:hypothetical protein